MINHTGNQESRWVDISSVLAEPLGSSEGNMKQDSQVIKDFYKFWVVLRQTHTSEFHSKYKLFQGAHYIWSIVFDFEISYRTTN